MEADKKSGHRNSGGVGSGSRSEGAAAQLKFKGSVIVPLDSSEWDEYPYSSLGKLITTYISGSTGDGTGFVWYPNTIATCRHNFTKLGTTKSATVGVGPGAETFDITGQEFPGGEQNSQDYAVARTNGLMSDFKQIPLYCVSDAELEANPKVMIPGFPADDPFPAMAPPDDLLSWDGAHLFYRISTQGGFSGSPVLWQKPDKEWVAIGIHGGEGDVKGEVCNEAVRLNLEVVMDMNRLNGLIPSS